MDEKLEQLYSLSRWRTGRKVGRTIYAQLQDQPNDYDTLIGVMDSPALAATVVHLHNDARAARLARVIRKEESSG